MIKKMTTAAHPMRWVPTLYLAEGLPFYAVALVAGLMYKSLGVPNEQIARWTGLIGLAWVFKSLWSPFLEVASSKKLIVVAFQLLGGVCLGLVALSLQFPTYFAVSIGLLASSPSPPQHTILQPMGCTSLVSVTNNKRRTQAGKVPFLMRQNLFR